MSGISSLLRGMRTHALKISHDHPLLSNAILYGGLYTLAEVCQQKLRANKALSLVTVSGAAGAIHTPSAIDRHEIPSQAKSLTASTSHHRLDLASVKRYAIMGTFVIPPILTKWYHWLDNRFPSTSTRTVLKKLILDQFLLTPWLLAMFFIGMSFLEGGKGRELLSELKQKFTMTFCLDCCYWLPIQALNFLFVPPMFRVVYIGVTTFIWMNILCFIKASPH